MAVLLGVVPSRMTIIPVSNAAQTQPQIGGVRQRKVRLGSHFRAAGAFPPLTMAAGRSHSADILACETEVAQLLVQQPELVIGTPGTTLVNGAGQSGFSLVIDGASASYPFQKGQFFNVVTASRRYLHTVQAAVTASGGGAATLSIWPMLRVSPADNTVLDFATPVIEGWLEIGGGWNVTPDWTVETEFDIEEAA